MCYTWTGCVRVCNYWTVTTHPPLPPSMRMTLETKALLQMNSNEDEWSFDPTFQINYCSVQTTVCVCVGEGGAGGINKPPVGEDPVVSLYCK